MRRICLILLLTAASGLAQEPVEAEPKKLVIIPPTTPVVSVQKQSNACAIPLLQAAPSKDVDPKIQRAAPNSDKTVAMPQYKGLPSCEKNWK